MSHTWALLYRTAKTSPQCLLILTGPTTTDVPLVLAPTQLVHDVSLPLLMWSQDPQTLQIPLFPTLLFRIGEKIVLDLFLNIATIVIHITERPQRLLLKLNLTNSQRLKDKLLIHHKVFFKKFVYIHAFNDICQPLIIARHKICDWHF